MTYLAIASFVVNGCSFDYNLDFDVFLGRGRSGLLGLLDRVQHAVVLRLPVPLLGAHVHVHVLKSKLVLSLQIFKLLIQKTNHEIASGLSVQKTN